MRRRRIHMSVLGTLSFRHARSLCSLRYNLYNLHPEIWWHLPKPTASGPDAMIDWQLGLGAWAVPGTATNASLTVAYQLILLLYARSEALNQLQPGILVCSPVVTLARYACYLIFAEQHRCTKRYLNQSSRNLINPLNYDPCAVHHI
jgi:hypothetical protein